MTVRAPIPKNWQPGPERFDVAALLECRQTPENRWQSQSWRLLGVICGGILPACGADGTVHDDGYRRQRLIAGLELRLHADEAESYYHNLAVARPRIFVIARQPEGDADPEPFLVSASFDVANAHVEADDLAFEAPLPAELCAPLEHFIIGHYVPEKRRKRKRDDWKGR